MKFYQIAASHFVAGIEFDLFGRIRRAAPILAWMQRRGMTEADIKGYCAQKRWKITQTPGESE